MGPTPNRSFISGQFSYFNINIKIFILFYCNNCSGLIVLQCIINIKALLEPSWTCIDTG